jgi:anti-sigma B factor antagonist
VNRVDESGSLHEPPVGEVREVDGALVVRLRGELDLYNAHLVRQTLQKAAADEPTRLVLDLSAVEFIDSTGLGVLIEARTMLADRDTFLLVSPGLEARRALAISGLDRLFAVHDTLEGALAAEIR